MTAPLGCGQLPDQRFTPGWCGRGLQDPRHCLDVGSLEHAGLLKPAPNTAKANRGQISLGLLP
jgi:hypothetical protein